MRNEDRLLKLLASTPRWRSVREFQVEVILKRRQFNLLGAAAWLCATAAQSAVADTHKVRVGVSMRGSMCHLPLWVADQLGYFRSAGLSLEWHDFDADAHAQQALATGQVDVLSGAFDQVLELNAQGQKVKAFVLQGQTPQISLGIAMRRLSSYQSMVDLKRFKIGISEWGSATHAMAQLWFLQAGLNPRDMQCIEVGNASAAIENLRSGVVDALCHTDPVMSWLEYKTDLRVVAETRTLQGAQQWLGGASAATCLFAKAEWLHNKPEWMQGLSDGVVRALKWLMTAGPTDLLKIAPPDARMGDRAFYLSTVDKVRESYRFDGLLSDALTETAWRNRALRLGLPRPSVVDQAALKAAYTNEAVQKSKKRFLV